MRVCIFVLLQFIFIATSFAGTIKSPRIVIFHINGVNTSLRDANINLNELMKASAIDSNIITWDVLYNPTHGLLASDLWDVIRMKKQESKDLNIDDYVIAYMKAYNLHYSPNSPEYKKLKNDIKEHYLNDPSIVGKNLKDIVDQFHEKVPPPYASSVVELLNQYKTAGSSNAYVLLVPHSQGNQYANQLWDFLVKGENFPANHLAIFGIASPADHIKGVVDIPHKPNGEPDPEDLIKYLTAENDLVINSMRLLSLFLPATNSPMPGNIELRCHDPLRHNLFDGYLFDMTSRRIIANKLSLLVISLKLKLIEEGMGNTIRLFFKYLEYIDNTDQIINRRNGNIICSSNHCDETVISYLNTDYAYDYDPYWPNFKIGFSDKLAASEYLYLSKLGWLLVRGNNLRSATAYKYDNEKCAYLKWIDELDIEQDKNSPFYGMPYANIHNRNGVDRDCSLALPEIYYKGKLMTGSFMVS